MSVPAVFSTGSLHSLGLWMREATISGGKLSQTFKER